MNQSLQEFLDERLPAKNYGIKGKPYIVSEHLKVSRPQTLRAIKRDFVPKSQREAAHVYVGVGAMFNLDAIFAAKADAAVIIDVNDAQEVVWEDIVAAVKKSPDCASFKKNFFQQRKGHGRQQPDFMALWDPQYAAMARREPDHPLQYRMFQDLGSDETDQEDAYQYIRDMVIHGRLAFHKLDLFDTEQCAALHNTIEQWRVPISRLGEPKTELPAKITTVYGSNVWDRGGKHVEVYNIELFTTDLIKRVNKGQDVNAAVRDGVTAQLKKYAAVMDEDTFDEVSAHIVSVLEKMVLDIPELAEVMPNGGRILMFFEGMPLWPRYMELLKANLTEHEMEDLGFAEEHIDDYHGRKIETHLDGIRALGGADAHIYLGATFGDMIKIDGTAAKQRPPAPDRT